MNFSLSLSLRACVHAHVRAWVHVCGCDMRVGACVGVGVHTRKRACVGAYGVCAHACAYACMCTCSWRAHGRV